MYSYFCRMPYKPSDETMDAVITWVDGSDEAQRKKIAHFISKEDAGLSPNVIPSRFDASGEIKYCVLSILKFAPFIRHIYIVTDGQRPDLDEVVSQYFPERKQDIRFIDHREIFQGFEEYLPLFNSRGIETMLWRIPGIADKFVYFNDDFFLVKPLRPEDWLQDGKLVLRGRWSLAPVFHLLWHRVLMPARKRRASFHLGQWNAARKAGFIFRYFVFEHTPYSISRTAQEEFFKDNPEALKNNISYRFRHPDQFNPCSLSYHLCLSRRKAIHRESPDLSYLQPSRRSADYITQKIRACEADSSVKFMCVQDLSISSEAQRKEIFSWLDSILGVSLAK